MWMYVAFQEFFLTVKDILRRSPATGSASFGKWGPEELQLNERYETINDDEHRSQNDNFYFNNTYML